MSRHFALSLLFVVVVSSLVSASASESQMVMEDGVPDYDHYGLLRQHVDRVKANPTDARSWSALCFLMRGAPIDLPDNSKNNKDATKPFTKKECYSEALRLDDTMGAAWYNVGVMLTHGESLLVKQVRRSRKDCFVKALEHSPTLASAWFNLGKELEVEERSSAPQFETLKQQRDYQRKRKESGVQDVVARVKGIAVNRLQCYVRALEADNRLPDGWNNAGGALRPGETFTVDGVRYNQRQAFAEELENNPEHDSAWYNAAVALDGVRNGYVEVDGAKYDRRKCLLRALKNNPQHAAAWHNLGASMHPKERLTINGVRNTSALTCLKNALEFEISQTAPTWFAIGTMLETNEKIKIVRRGDQLQQQQQKKNKKKKKPRGGNKKNKKQQKQSNDVAGTEYGKRECFLEAIKATPDWGDPWNNMATVVERGDTIEILGKEYTQRDLLVRAVELTPEEWRTWQNLCTTLEDGDQITVDGGVFNKETCQKHAKELQEAEEANPRRGLN